jgi:TetR/AcrR family transcriptional regulator, transcriptional repressor for nem operon
MPRHPSRTRLLDATIKVVRTKGYNATRVEDVCAEAGVTKGSFFHHFKSKDDLALAALDHWRGGSGTLFANAPYHLATDPLDRLLGYIDFRKTLLTGGVADFTCFPGTMVQEAYASHPAIRAGCESSLCGHARTLEADIDDAMRRHGVSGHFTARSLALHMQCVIQGAFVFAKATGSAAVAADSLDHLRRYITLLFGAPARPGSRPTATRDPAPSRAHRRGREPDTTRSDAGEPGPTPCDASDGDA